MINFIYWWYHFVLNFFQKLFFHRIPIDDSNRKILIWRDAHLGDGIVSLSSFQRIRNHYPKSTLVLLSHNGGINGIHISDYISDGIFDEIWDRSEWTWMELYRRISLGKFDSAIALMPYSSSLKFLLFSLFFIRLTGIKFAGGWQKSSTFLFASRQMKRNFISETDRQIEILNLLGIRQCSSVPLPIKIESSGYRIDGNTVLLAPFSKASAHYWGDEQWIQLGFSLIEKKYSILVTGNKAQSEIVAPWLSVWKQGEFVHVTIPKLADIIQQVDWVIGADSGVIHLAAILNQKHVVLFGNSDYRGKWNHQLENQIAVYPKMNCGQCIGKRNQICSCMESVQLDAVLNAIASY
jgi:ADP-heptose:LPS heptosyltransferase